LKNRDDIFFKDYELLEKLKFAIELINQKQNSIRYITEYDLLSLYFEKRYQEFKNFG